MRGWRGRALRLDAAKRAAQFIQFALVGDLLALRDFDEFQNLVHLVVQLLERLGDEGGVLDRLGNGRGRGGPEIGRLDPLALTDRDARWRLLRAVIAAVITPMLAAIIAAIIAARRARRFGGADGFGSRRAGFRLRRFGGWRVLVSVKTFRRFGVRLAESAGGVGLLFGGRCHLFLGCGGGGFGSFGRG
jgi:hypothetical protein